jgi:hypothetical protein
MPACEVAIVFGSIGPSASAKIIAAIVNPAAPARKPGRTTAPTASATVASAIPCSKPLVTLEIPSVESRTLEKFG